MNPQPPSSKPRLWTRFRVVLLLGLLLLVVNGVAIWGILSGRGEARLAAAKELELQTTVQARAFEAQLADLRADLLFLSQSPPLLRLPSVTATSDPVERRWGRRNAEGTLLLFLEANPAVERVVIERSGEEMMAVGRRRGKPILLPLSGSRTVGDERSLTAVLRLGASRQEIWQLVALVDPGALLALVAPGPGDGLRLVRQLGEPVPEGAPQVAQVLIETPHWQTAQPLVLRREGESRVMGSVESLARSYRTTVVLYLAMALLALIFGGMAFRQVRRVARLEAENAQQAQIRDLERQLMHSERLASVGRLAAGMAHEINNPLAGMTNYLALLEEDLREGHTEDAPELIAHLREGLERTAGITHQALRLADPGRGVQVPLDLGEVIGRTVEFLSGNPAHREIEFRWTPPVAPLQMAGNPITLGQLFLNLMLNACQNQASGGIVEVVIEELGDRFKITVADRGPGFSGEASARLFEPFFSSRGSTGLGLAICRRIVEDHRGEINGRNRPRGGAIFEVLLPKQAMPDSKSRKNGESKEP